MARTPGLGRVRTALLGIAVVAAAVVGSVETAFAQSQARRIEGVWDVSATVRDCATDAPLGPPIRALLTYHHRGTVTESVALLLFAPGQRTIGHGTWKRSGDSFIERVLTIIVFDTPPSPPSPGFQAGWTSSTQTITMIDGNNFTSRGGLVFYDINRQPIREGCATRVGRRFQ